jgi:SAM-dependent methyltransferase
LHIIADPIRALRGVQRVLRHAGVFACSVWADDDPRWGWESELFAQCGAQSPRTPRDLSNSDKLTTLLGDDWTDVRIRTSEYTATLHDEDECWAWKWSYGIRGALEALDQAARARLKAAAFERMQAQREPSGFPVQLRALLATIRKQQ